MDEINFLLVLWEDSGIFLVPRTVREHLEIKLHLVILHVPQHSLVFHLSMFFVASNTSQVCNACLRTLHDENLGPQVLDERVWEELIAECDWILLEYVHEKGSLLAIHLMHEIVKGLTVGAWEEEC